MLDKQEILDLLARLSEELAKNQVVGELYLVGGAVMCLVFEEREATKGVDGFFKPVQAVRIAARRVAAASGSPEDWLNDAVKGFLADKGDFQPYLELSHLRVMTASPQYLLAMKCLAMRLGPEFHDEEDVRFLIRYLNLTDYDGVIGVVAKYYPLARIPQKTLWALEEMLAGW